MQLVDGNSLISEHLGDLVHDPGVIVTEQMQHDWVARGLGRSALDPPDRDVQHPEALDVRHERFDSTFGDIHQDDAGEFAGQAGHLALQPVPLAGRHRAGQRRHQARPVVTDRGQHQFRHDASLVGLPDAGAAPGVPRPAEVSDNPDPLSYPQAVENLHGCDYRCAVEVRALMSGRGESAKPDTILRNDEKSGPFWGGFCETRGPTGGRRPGVTDSRSWWMCFGCLRTVGCSASWRR